MNTQSVIVTGGAAGIGRATVERFLATGANVAAYTTVMARTEPDDAENLTNRAPYPILHLLREDSVDRAVAAYPEPDSIIERNVAAMQELGSEGFGKLLSDKA